MLKIWLLRLSLLKRDDANERRLLSANLGCARLQFASKLALYSLARALRRREIYLPKN